MCIRIVDYGDRMVEPASTTTGPDVEPCESLCFCSSTRFGADDPSTSLAGSRGVILGCSFSYSPKCFPEAISELSVFNLMGLLSRIPNLCQYVRIPKGFWSFFFYNTKSVPIQLSSNLTQDISVKQPQELTILSL